MAARRGPLPVLALRRRAIPKSNPPSTPDRHLLHSPSLLEAVAASASASLSPNLLSCPPTSAGAVAAAGPTAVAPVAEYPLELLSPQLAGWFPSPWPLFQGPWFQGPLFYVVTALLDFWAHWRSTPEGPDDMVLMLVGANVAVYVLCRLADPKFKMNHFMNSLDNFMSGRLHTLLTCAFSHIDVNHLFINMTDLYIYGSSIAGMFGPAFLLKLYLTGAITGSAFFLAERAVLAPRKECFGGWKTPMLGASAAVNATTLLEVFLYPTKVRYSYLVIPVPAALVGAVLIGADLLRFKMKDQDCVAGSAHLGGAFVAAFVWANLKGWI